jgi:hypothetical protein
VYKRQRGLGDVYKRQVLNDNSLNLVRCSAELFSCVTRHLLLGGGRVKFPDSGIYLKCAHCATLPHTSTETLGRVFLGLGKGAVSVQGSGQCRVDERLR